jgi:TetR/AcrR family transcriptional regulator
MEPGKSRNAEATKKIILEAAEKLFAEKGFAGTSIREIAEKSGVSGPLILFHFRSKKCVYSAVKEAIIQRYKNNQSLKPRNDESISAFLGNMIDSIFSFYRDNPTMVRLASWAHLEGAEGPWPGEDELHHVFQKYLREAQERGEIRDDITPFNISAIVCGAIHIWWEFHSHLAEHEEKQTDSPSIDELYTKQLLDLVLRGLSPQQ